MHVSFDYVWVKSRDFGIYRIFEQCTELMHTMKLSSAWADPEWDGGSESNPPPMENHNLIYVSLEILVQVHGPPS